MSAISSNEYALVVHSTQTPKPPVFDHIWENLFLSDFSAAQDPGVTADIKIIIDASNEPHEELEGKEYVYLTVNDDRETDLKTHFATVIDKIKEARLNGENVLVHCVMGVSRSVTLVLAFLLAEGVCPSLKSAIDFLKTKRSQNTPVHPNMGFFEQLLRLEFELTGTNSIKPAEFYNIKIAPELPRHILTMIEKMKARHGLEFPWECTACHLFNDRSPAHCNACGTPNGTYDSSAAASLIQENSDDVFQTDGRTGDTATLAKVKHGGRNLIVVLHIVNDSSDHSIQKLKERTVEQATIAFQNGADGVFLIIGEAGISANDVVACYRAVRIQYPDKFIGINFLASSSVACARIPDDADALWTDFGVDRAGAHREALATRQQLKERNWRGLHFGGFFFKGFDQRLSEDPARAMGYGQLASQCFQVLTTSGPGTGQPISLDQLKRVHAAAKGAPVALASGVDDDNVDSFLPYVQYFVIGTGVECDSPDPSTQQFYSGAQLGRAVMVGNLDGHRVARLAAKIHAK